MSLALPFRVGDEAAGVPDSTAVDVEAASSSADCRAELACAVAAVAASFCAFVCRFRGDALPLTGLAIFEGEADRNLVLPRPGVLPGAASLGPFSGISNLGGAAIAFFALDGLCEISVGSRRALIHSVKPYASASSSAGIVSDVVHALPLLAYHISHQPKHSQPLRRGL